MDLIETSKSIKRRSDLFYQVISVCNELLLNLKGIDKVREYAFGRISKDCVKKFHVGYFPENISDLFKYIDRNVLFELGLAFDNNIGIYSFFKNHNLIFPYYDLYNNIIAIVGRTLNDDEFCKEYNIEKYKNTKFEKSFNLFGINLAKDKICETDNVLLVEGQIDCITCHKFGIENVVAVGTSHLSWYQSLSLLNRFTDNIYVAFDNDTGGETGLNNILKHYSERFNVKKVDVSPFKDIDQLLTKSCDLSFLYKSGFNF